MDTLVSQCRGRSNISLDSMNMMGTLLAAIAYGALPSYIIQLRLQGVTHPLIGIVLIICSLVLWTGSSGHQPNPTWRTLMTCYLILLATTSIALQIKWTLLAFVTQQNNLSPSIFIEENVNNWIYVTLNAL